jgi:hypothetical protein
MAAMKRPLEPTGAPWWWHLSEDEREQYMALLEESGELLQAYRVCAQHRQTWRTVANNRCKAEERHAHTMHGLVPLPPLP